MPKIRRLTNEEKQQAAEQKITKKKASATKTPDRKWYDDPFGSWLNHKI